MDPQTLDPRLEALAVGAYKHAPNGAFDLRLRPGAGGQIEYEIVCTRPSPGPVSPKIARGLADAARQLRVLIVPAKIMRGQGVYYLVHVELRAHIVPAASVMDSPQKLYGYELSYCKKIGGTEDQDEVLVNLPEEA